MPSNPSHNGSDGSDDDQDSPPVCDPNSPINPVGCVYADGAGADAFENRIIDSDLAPCMMDEMNTLLTVNKGVGEIIHDFAIDQLNPDPMLGNLNWIVRDGDLPVNVYGETYDYNGVTHTVFTKFDTDKFDTATDIAVAQTMLHEAVHAYLTAYFYSNNAVFQKTYAELFEMYIETSNIEASQHAYMAINFVGQIAEALQGFGNYYGLNIDYQYYHDLAWGGLQQTTYFKNLNPLVKHRIKNRLSAELTGRNMVGQKKTPKGKSSGC